MRCTECSSTVEDDDASICPFCGSSLAVDRGATIVSSAETGDEPPRAGAVLAERYELQERVGMDSLTLRYRAIDQETEATVLVTVVAPPLLASDADRDAVIEKLTPVLGVGGRYLPDLLAVERERNWVFTVEAWPKGTPLRLAMTARATLDKRYSPAETLPIVAQLAAAVDAIPPPYCHGDVRVERVWLDGDQVSLTGAFLVAALPPAVVSAAVAADPRLRSVLAPEVRRGKLHGSADRYGIAAIALEALASVQPQGSPLLGLALPSVVAHALEPVLADDASVRPSTLASLLQALATSAGVEVPQCAPGPFRKRRRNFDGRRVPSDRPPEDESREKRTESGGHAAAARAAVAKQKERADADEPDYDTEAQTVKRSMDEMLLDRRLRDEDPSSVPTQNGVAAPVDVPPRDVTHDTAPAARFAPEQLAALHDAKTPTVGTPKDTGAPDPGTKPPAPANDDSARAPATTVPATPSTPPPRPADAVFTLPRDTHASLPPPPPRRPSIPVEGNATRPGTIPSPGSPPLPSPSAPPVATPRVPVPGAAPGGTDEIALEELGGTADDDDSIVRDTLVDTRETGAAPSPARIDSAQVRAALALPALPATPTTTGKPPESLKKSPDTTQELTADQVEEEVANDTAPTGTPARPEPQPPAAAPLVLSAAPAQPPTAAAAPKPQQAAARSAPPKAIIELPEGIKPIPKPRRPSLPGVYLDDADPLFDDSVKTTPLTSGQAKQIAAQAASQAARARASAPPSAPRNASVRPAPGGGGSEPTPRSVPSERPYPRDPAPPVAKSGAGTWIVLGAVFIAAAIIAAGWGIRHMREARREREQHEQRMEMLRRNVTSDQP